MFFNLLGGNSEKHDVWRADNWLHVVAAGGYASILMYKKDIISFVAFLRTVKDFPEGMSSSAGKYTFESEEYDEGCVNILIGGQDFVYVFNIHLSMIERFCEYLEANV